MHTDRHVASCVVLKEMVAKRVMHLCMLSCSKEQLVTRKQHSCTAVPVGCQLR
jgi:hypothetical protein